MSKVTSKLQVTVPKAVADQYGIRPGEELDWVPAGDAIRVIPATRRKMSEKELTLRQRLELFDRATERQRQRNERLRKRNEGRKLPVTRGWTREEIYSRDLPD